MSASPAFQVGAVVLGYVGIVASWRRPAPGYETKHSFCPMLTIQQCSNTDEGAHTPAESVTLSGRDALIALREAVDEALKVPA